MGRPLRVFLGDLIHTSPLGSHIDAFPLNVGFIGSYIQKEFPNEVSVQLFKYPNDLLQALKHSPPDILALSNYPWNKNLSIQMLRVADGAGRVIKVLGGPNFPTDRFSQARFLKKLGSLVHFYVNLEGETGFKSLLEKILSHGLDVDGLKRDPIESVVFLRDSDEVVIGPQLSRLKNLDDSIPSPYLTGILDPFFEYKLIPTIQTTRGCPFTCSFCHEGEAYYQKVGMFSQERVVEEIKYITKKVKHSGVLMITDSNFGMFERDIEIARCLQQTYKEYRYPNRVWATTGKNQKERVLEVVKLLEGRLSFSATVQSMDAEVLQNVRRKNIRLEDYVVIQHKVQDGDLSSYAEMILGLPGDSLTKHLDGYRALMACGVNRIGSYNCMLLESTHLNTPSERLKYGIKGMFRLLPRNFGEYDGAKVFETEEIVVSTDTLKMDETLYLRRFHVVQNILYNSTYFEEYIRYFRDVRFDIVDLIMRMLEQVDSASEAIRRQMYKLDADARAELFETEDALFVFFKDPRNYDRLAAGAIGGNLLQKNTAEAVTLNYSDWLDFTARVAAVLIEEGSGYSYGLAAEELHDLRRFLRNKYVDLTSPELQQGHEGQFTHDILAWRRDRYTRPLSHYRSSHPVTYKFSLSEEQVETIRTFQRQYGTHLDGIGRMLTRINPSTLKLQISAGEAVESRESACDPVELFQMPSAESHS